SPYFVEYSDVVAKALTYAKPELRDYDVLPALEAYFKHQAELPLWVVEVACQLNLRDITIHARYQYLWFCLHETTLTRTQPSGRVFRTKVQFPSCYVQMDAKLRSLLLQACAVMEIPLRKFPALCGYKKADYIKSLPLLAIMKICQIQQTDIWALLAGRALFGMTRKTGQIVIPRNFNDVNIMILLIWLRTDGHLELGSTHIEINQTNSLLSLEALRKLVVHTFKFNTKNLKFFKGSRGEDRLIISSSALRQFLTLRYEIPIGYKSRVLQEMNFDNFSIQDKLRMLPAFIQSEGSLSYHYTRNKKKRLPRFEFIVADRNLALDCLRLLQSFGYSPTFSERQNLFKVGMYSSNEVIGLITKTRPYLSDDRKIKELLANGIRL
ncbi:MAG TPA: hypothetical protein VJK52_05975, partial [Candidatus Nanoarchaeia archaeon]|nr:hypothetical protein [Candidatus Nanoarchaeia archaeon]